MNLIEIRKRFEILHNNDSELKQVEVESDTLENALREASIQLEVPIKKIFFDIKEKGASGFFGVGKKIWKILAYTKVDSTALKSEKNIILGEDGEVIDSDVIKDKDGVCTLRFIASKIYFSIRAPQGNGVPIGLDAVKTKLRKRGVFEYNVKLIEKIVKEMKGKEVVIGEFDHNLTDDPAMEVIFSDDNMSAMIRISVPGYKGEDFTSDQIFDFLIYKQVSSGYLNDEIEELGANPEYNVNRVVAKGVKAKHGKNGYIDYKFRTDLSKIIIDSDIEKDGQLDFKTLNKISNVLEGDVVAIKVLPEKGIDGVTVQGKILPAREGQDIPLNIGENVKVLDDGLTVVALINGEALLVDGKITVQPIYTVNGTVNNKTSGNIGFIGSVIVKGDVEDGFSIKASKDIHISGSIGKCEISSGGDIFVGQGIQAKGGGLIKCSGNVIAKFITNSNLEVGGKVIAGDGIINSFVNCQKNIICFGKRGKIHGGHLRAGEKIISKEIGSINGTETILEVGIDPDKKKRYLELDLLIRKAKEDIDAMDKNMMTLENNMKNKLKVSQEKVDDYKKLREDRDALLNSCDKYHIEYDEIKEYLTSLKESGEISAEQIIHPGVKLTIGNSQQYSVTNSFKWATFYQESSLIKNRGYSVNKEDLV